MKLRNRTFFQKLIRPAIGFVKFRILHVDDTPQRVARGVAIGLWIGFSPLMGFHMILSLAAAALMRANKALAVLFVWVSNPFTVLPIYVPCYLVGRFLVGHFHQAAAVEPRQIAELLNNLFSFSKMVTCLHSTAFWKEMAVVFGKIGLEVTVGSLILGTFAAIIGYFTTYWLVTTYRTKSGRRRFRQILQ